jgi:hypothetical protein
VGALAEPSRCEGQRSISQSSEEAIEMPSRKTLPILAAIFTLICVCAPVFTEGANSRPEGVVIDQSADMLVPPATLKDATSIDIAKTPCKIRFSVVEGCDPFPEDNTGCWSSWSESILASDGNYYSAISDHRGVDGRTFIVRYDPETGEQKEVFHSDKLLDHKPGTYGHGKIHGRLDEYPPGHLIAATYWGIPPMDTKYKGERWTGPIPGGYLIRVDLAKGTTENLGVPFVRDSWPMFATDTKRGIFHAIGYDRHYLAYDLANSRPLYAALPPPNIHWFERATLVDEKTGFCYSNSGERMVKYDLEKNEITYLEAEIPDNPGSDEHPPSLRCYTRRRTADGAYLCHAMDGTVFKFYPDTEAIERVDINWGKGHYCTSSPISPGDRYLYYTVDVHGSAYTHGSPVVQYDLVEKRRKVLCFLHPYYQEKHGYVFGGSYSVVVNEDGSQIFITWNGKFRETEKEGESFGDPSFMLIDIPESERIE